MRTISVLVLGAALLLGSMLSLASRHGHIASAAPNPTATYVSELGPASVRPPGHATTLPSAGSDGPAAGLAWSKLAGLGLTLCGVVMIHAALRMRSDRLEQS